MAKTELHVTVGSKEYESALRVVWQLATRCIELEEALREAKSNLIWSTGGWGDKDEIDIQHASRTMRIMTDAIDKVLGE